MSAPDIDLLHNWLNNKHVHQWYDKDKTNTIEEVKKRYLPKILGEKSTDCFLACIDNKPFGYVQAYRVTDWPEFGDYIGYDHQSASVDLFIGDEEYLGKGYGQSMLHQFLKNVVFTDETINTCVIGPEPDNQRAIAVYQKVGFRFKKTVHIPGDDHPTYLMELRKSDF